MKKKEVKVESINEQNRPIIEYPCSWTYKLIGNERAGIEIAAFEVLEDIKYSLTPSNASKGGKYISMNLELIVECEDSRLKYYELLKAHQHIKMVL